MVDHKDDLLTVSLLNKELTIRCPSQLQERLLEAIVKLEKRLKEIQTSEHLWNRDDILSITAVNLMFELLELQQETADHKQKVASQVRSILNKLKAIPCEEVSE